MGPKHATIRTRSGRHSAGVAYIVIPSDADRARYVNKCMRTNTVGIYTEQNEVVWNVRINENDLQSAYFPATYEELGSAVVFVTLPETNQPVIVTTLTKEEESNVAAENQYIIEKVHANGDVQIIGNAEYGFMQIKASGVTGTKMLHLVKDEQGGGLYEVQVQGTVNIEADKSINLLATESFNFTVSDPDLGDVGCTLEYVQGTGLTYTDQYGNSITTTSTGMVINGNTIKVGDQAVEAAALGLTLQTQLTVMKARQDALFTALTAWVPVPTDGGASLKIVIAAALGFPTADFSQILSTKTTIE